MARAPDRPGSALVIALALTSLGAALLVGSAAAGRAATRSAQAHEAAAIADAEVRVTLAQYMARWSGADDSVSVGSERQSVLPLRWSGSLPVVGRARLVRLSTSRFILGVESQVGPVSSPIAIRRLSLLLERPLAVDSTMGASPPLPVRRWGVADLY
jgi:hypothetical protein